MDVAGAATVDGQDREGRLASNVAVGPAGDGVGKLLLPRAGGQAGGAGAVQVLARLGRPGR